MGDCNLTDWDSYQRWRVLIERDLNAVQASVRGMQSGESRRIADLIEQVDELRKELAAQKAETARAHSRLDAAGKLIKELGK